MSPPHVPRPPRARPVSTSSWVPPAAPAERSSRSSSGAVCRSRAVTRSGSRDGAAGRAWRSRPRTCRRLRTCDAPWTGASVVYHAANPPYQRWLAEFPAMNAAIIDAVADAGAKLVFADNLYLLRPERRAP